jgi:hypothetical protein
MAANCLFNHRLYVGLLAAMACGLFTGSADAQSYTITMGQEDGDGNVPVTVKISGVGEDPVWKVKYGVATYGPNGLQFSGGTTDALLDRHFVTPPGGGQAFSHHEKSFSVPAGTGLYRIEYYKKVNSVWVIEDEGSFYIN